MRVDGGAENTAYEPTMSETSTDCPTRPFFYQGAVGNRLAASRVGPETGHPVLLVHGGGQTRHAWDETADALAARGWRAIAFDQRGHGQSDWIENGDYSYTAYASDLAAVARAIEAEYGRRPVIIGASLGGVSGILVAGEIPDPPLSALVLVDITAKPEREGVARVIEFMAERSDHGFASLEEAAEAIAGYLPHRRRPPSTDGLSKNLRLHDDGRYRWHWDPRFLECREMGDGMRERLEERFTAAAANMTCPVLLVRGRLSDLVTEEAARTFLELVPHADFADVSEAGHMIAGDSNDVFTGKIVDFLDKISD